MTAIEVRELKAGDPNCRDIPYPQLKAPTQVDWITEVQTVKLQPDGSEKTTSETVTRKGWFLHECHACEHQWVCQHAECGDKAHGCTREAA